MQNFGTIHGLMAMINLKICDEVQNFEEISSNRRAKSEKVKKWTFVGLGALPRHLELKTIKLSLDFVAFCAPHNERRVSL